MQATVFPTEYVHDLSNGGLAAAYNFALAQAEAQQRAWLLLFDQYTMLTKEFLFGVSRVCRGRCTVKPKVGAIVPKLLVRGAIYSPEAITFLDQVRHHFSLLSTGQ